MTDHLDNLPKIHPRHEPVEAARNALLSFLIDWRQRHDLTSAEYTTLLADAIRSYAGMLVQHERRGQSQ